MPLYSLQQIINASQALYRTDYSAPSQLPHLLSNLSSSVTVVNFIFPPTAQPIHQEGFGYLIPRKDNSSDPYFTDFGSMPLQDRLIGVVFDSCALSAQDTYPEGDKGNQRFTKLTLMLKGISSWDVNEEELMKILTKHLRPVSPLPRPVYMRVNTHSDCIPIPGVGHVQRMAELQTELKRGFWDERFAVLGAGVGGVSVPDCVEQGRIIASRWSST